MKIMVVGGGGREHAIIKKLRENPKAEIIYALPGNGGIAEDAVCVDIKACDIDKIVEFALEAEIDYAVVAPDDPLVLGVVDALTAHGIECFGPDKSAAVIEGSKSFAKSLMKKYKIPTADFEVFDDMSQALEYLETVKLPTVIKADGLALGKGVVIAKTREEAGLAVRRMMEKKAFGNSGNRIVIEEYLEGPEVSVLAFADGKTIKPMVSSMDHKRVFDGDLGPNTGGMGAIAPNPFYSDAIADECMEQIFVPTIQAMTAEGRTFKGCLYFGLMLTPQGPRVIEYNCRFGDPETQAILPLLESDLLEIMLAVTHGELDKCNVIFSKKHSCCVVAASHGYPTDYESGKKIECNSRNSLFFAGVKRDGEKLFSSGGRVLSVYSTGDTLEDAIRSAYRKLDGIKFENMFFRQDIGRRALEFYKGE